MLSIALGIGLVFGLNLINLNYYTLGKVDNLL
jgi:hypothetical protein